MSRTLAEGGGEDAPALSNEEQERLLAPDHEGSARRRRPPGGLSTWGWLRPVLVGSGVVAMASLVWIVSRETEVGGTGLGPPETGRSSWRCRPRLRRSFFRLTSPMCGLGMGALTWRGSGRPTTAINCWRNLKNPGLDAYRGGTTTPRRIANSRRWPTVSPGTIEILFYQGVSRLFLDDYSGALASFDAADAVGDQMFAPRRVVVSRRCRAAFRQRGTGAGTS